MTKTNLENSILSQAPSNIFELGETEKLKQTVNQLEEEKEKLKDLLMKIEQAYGGDLNSDDLVTKILQDQEKLKSSDLKIQELLEKNNSILTETQVNFVLKTCLGAKGEIYQPPKTGGSP